MQICLVMAGVAASILLLLHAAGHAAGPPPTGEWQDQIVYVLIPHKFLDADPSNNVMRGQYNLPNPKYKGGLLGGDIAGIRRKIGYLKGLGITSVLLYPVFDNDRGDFMGHLPTGYRVRDYRSIDPNLGTPGDVDGMLADFHSTQGGQPRLNVILDLPIAMTGLEHPWAKRPGDFPHYFRPWNAANPADNITSPPRTTPYGPVDTAFGMPIIAHTNGMDSGSATYRAVRDDVAFWLADRFDIDGFRYDSAQNVEPAFWRTFLPEFRTRRPGFIHVGEVFIYPKRTWQLEQHDYMSSASGIRMDGMYDFGMIERIQTVFAEGADARDLADWSRRCDALYDEPARLAASIDNYEDPTFLARVKDGQARARAWLASVFLMTANRVPFIYSGNECGLDTTQPGELFSDRCDTRYRDRFRHLVSLRRQHAALRRGRMEWLQTSPTLMVFGRTHGRQQVVVALNVSAHTCVIDANLGAAGGRRGVAVDMLDGRRRRVPMGAGQCAGRLCLHVELAPWEARVWAVE